MSTPRSFFALEEIDGIIFVAMSGNKGIFTVDCYDLAIDHALSKIGMWCKMA